jgi:hypothetical protein
VISEFLAAHAPNGSAPLAPPGAPPGDGARDWVELLNASPAPVDLAGWALEAGGKNKGEAWVLPAVQLPAGGYIVLIGGGKGARARGGLGSWEAAGGTARAGGRAGPWGEGRLAAALRPRGSVLSAGGQCRKLLLPRPLRRTRRTLNRARREPYYAQRPRPSKGNSTAARPVAGPGGVQLLPLEGLKLGAKGEPLALKRPGGAVASATGELVRRAGSAVRLFIDGLGLPTAGRPAGPDSGCACVPAANDP